MAGDVFNDDEGLPVQKRDGKKGRNIEEFDMDKYV